ncbi:unnamed protein product [Trichogramma brassicae]|uniref:Uncharacterized protein n=1 Tax=Trichogramma brassicae TaxID=86971 RepID=A0A6H5ILB2_9HYME|nr:unnamed protein product [Trichogramma brassicae]
MNSKFRSSPVDESPKSREKHIYTRARSRQQQQRLARASLNKYPPVDINARDKVNNLPLHFSLSRGYTQEAEELLRKGANPNSTDKEGWTPLHVICERRGDEDVQVRMLFELSSEKYQPVQVNVQNDEGNTPLHGAAINNKPKVVKLLLKNGSDPNLINKNGETPLHNICKRMRIKEASASLLRTTLTLKNLKNRMKAAKSLLRRGANPNLVDKNGSTPLFIICNGVLEDWEHMDDTQLRSALKKT